MTSRPSKKTMRPRRAAADTGAGCSLRPAVRRRPKASRQDRRSALDEAGEGAAVGTLRQFLQRLGFDLANALAGHLILAADLFERVLARLADAEAQAQDVRLARREARQRVVGGGAQLGLRR